MRLLTLDEKISLKGLLARKGMRNLMEIKSVRDFANVWYSLYGSSILYWRKIPLITPKKFRRGNKI